MLFFPNALFTNIEGFVLLFSFVCLYFLFHEEHCGQLYLINIALTFYCRMTNYLKAQWFQTTDNIHYPSVYVGQEFVVIP
jgi:hypothetical protein